MSGSLNDANSQRFDAIVAEYGAALGRLVRAYVALREDQDDLLQDIWLALWQSLPRFRGECSQRTFVYRVAHNRALTFRSRHRKPLELLNEEVVDPAPDPAAHAARQDLSDRLASAIRGLDEPYREAVALHLEGLSAAEIASVQGTTAGNVAVRLTRARDALRRHFNPSVVEEHS
jgi:RNA polymerase sigma-70 factor (ECF subfamily)